MNITFCIKDNLAKTKIKPFLGKLFLLKGNKEYIELEDGMILNIDVSKKQYIVWQKDEGITDGEGMFEIDFKNEQLDKSIVSILNAPCAEGVKIAVS